MAAWQKPPRPATEIIQDFLNANTKGYSLSFDRENKMQHLEIPSLDEAGMAVFMARLQKEFPDLF